MAEVLKMRFLVRCRTAAAWASIDEVLLKSTDTGARELGIEEDTGKMKLGNDVAWSLTPYLPNSMLGGAASPMVVNPQAGTSYQASKTDAGADIKFSNPAPITCTIPTVATAGWEVGDWFIESQAGAGTVTTVGASGVTFESSTLNKTRGIGDVVGLEMVAPNVWRFIGSLGFGLPIGGTTGQMPRKASSGDGDVVWVDPPTSLPTGGTLNQVLTKQSATDGDALWKDATGGSGGAAVSGIGTTLVTKTTTESRASTTTVTPDSQLAVALKANTAYRVEATYVWSSGSSAMKAGVNYTGAGTCTGRFSVMGTSGTSDYTQTIGPSSLPYLVSPGTTPGATQTAYIDLVVRTTTAGVLSCSWAQVTSSGTPVNVLAGSFLQVTETGTGTGGPSGGDLAVSTAVVGNVGAGVDNLMAYIVPSTTLAKDGDRLRARATFGAAGTANAKSFQVKFGTATIFDSGGAIPVSAADDIVADIEIIRVSGTTQLCSVSVASGNAVFQGTAKVTAATETLSGSVTLQCTGSGTADNDIVQKSLSVWKGAGSTGYPEGPANPTAPTAGDKFYRTDLNLLIFYDGTRWLTVQQYHLGIGSLDQLTPNSAGITLRFPVRMDMVMYIERVALSAYVAGTNNATNYWTFQLDAYNFANAITPIGTVNSSAKSASGWNNYDMLVGMAVPAGTMQLQMNTGKTGSPGSLYCPAAIIYRLIVT